MPPLRPFSFVLVVPQPKYPIRTGVKQTVGFALPIRFLRDFNPRLGVRDEPETPCARSPLWANQGLRVGKPHHCIPAVTAQAMLIATKLLPFLAAPKSNVMPPKTIRSLTAQRIAGILGKSLRFQRR